MESISGIQLGIIPQLSNKVKFICPQCDTTKPQIDTSDVVFQTFQELGMALDRYQWNEEKQTDEEIRS